MKAIATFLIEENCTIFGGYIRDMLIHDHYAKLFYQSDSSVMDYENTDTHTESAKRVLLPKDIDVFIGGTRENVLEILKKLQSHLHMNVVIATYDKNQTKTYEIFKAINLINASIYMCRNVCRSVVVKLDFLFSTEYEMMPPFGRLDLTCNGFLLDKHGLRHCSLWNPYSSLIQQHMIQHQYILDILKMKTEVKWQYSVLSREETINLVMRVGKMIKRGWKIDLGVDITSNIPKRGAKCCYTGCSNQEQTNVTVNHFGISTRCCGKVYHVDCFVLFTNDRNCLHKSICKECKLKTIEGTN